MHTSTALRLAGPDALLVSRPTGVAHIYTGPLTPSGRFIPRNRRAVCRTHTRRLTVVTYSDRAALHRVCARCAAALSSLQGGGATPRTRLEYKARYAHVSPWQLAVEAADATSMAELDVVAHLSLALFDHPGCLRPVTAPDGTTGESLHQCIERHRRRLNPEHGDHGMNRRLDEMGVTGRVRRRAEREDIRRQRDLRIERVGMNNAKP